MTESDREFQKKAEEAIENLGYKKAEEILIQCLKEAWNEEISGLKHKG